MLSDFANLTIDKIIIHEIFARTIDREVVEPTYGSDLSELGHGGRKALTERIVNALGADSHSMELNIENDEGDSVLQHCGRILADEKQFIDCSKSIALRLAKAQVSRRIPGGVVVIFQGTTGKTSQNYVGIIKAEIHSGFAKTTRKHMLSIEFINSLLLTPQQKLYKIGLFVEQSVTQSAERSPAEFRAFVFDHNMTNTETKQAALYFYDTFLGCSLSPTHKKLTRDFYDLTKEFINKLDVDDERRMDLGDSLYSYLKVSQSSVISIRDYSNEYLPKKLHDSYAKHMVDNGYPLRAVHKNLAYIERRLRRRKITFTSKVRIYMPSEDSSNLFKVIGHKEGRTIASIQGQIEKDE